MNKNKRPCPHLFNSTETWLEFPAINDGTIAGKKRLRNRKTALFSNNIEVFRQLFSFSEDERELFERPELSAERCFQSFFVKKSFFFSHVQYFIEASDRLQNEETTFIQKWVNERVPNDLKAQPSWKFVSIFITCWHVLFGVFYCFLIYLTLR